MHYTTAFLLTGLSALSAAKPLARRDIATFAPGTVWDIVLDDSKFDVAALKGAKGDVIDIDLEDNYKGSKAGTIKQLRDAGKTVICYFSAGSFENWRADANTFEKADYGKNMTWPGENWIDVKRDHVKTIMTKRIQNASDAGCHAIDPDNIDGFVNNQDGFNYDRKAYIDYVKWLSDTAKGKGLAMGLKNGIEIIGDVIDYVQFAVNEQCHTIPLDDGTNDSECVKYKPFTEAKKAVFNIEYGGNDCSDPKDVNLSTVIKSEDQSLNTLGGQC